MSSRARDWHEGTCADCGGSRNNVLAVHEHGELCIVCLDRLEEKGDPAVVEVFADA